MENKATAVSSYGSDNPEFYTQTECLILTLYSEAKPPNDWRNSRPFSAKRITVMEIV